MRVQFTRCLGSMFSPTAERPKKPVPIVKDGARCVEKPAAPWLHGAFTATRSAFTVAAYFRMVCALWLWIAAECPAPERRLRARGMGDAAWALSGGLEPNTRPRLR